MNVDRVAYPKSRARISMDGIRTRINFNRSEYKHIRKLEHEYVSADLSDCYHPLDFPRARTDCCSCRASVSESAHTTLSPAYLVTGITLQTYAATCLRHSIACPGKTWIRSY
jgi:predicted HicB family RNase H-like nuclease